jgi:predicted Zn-dependent protease
LARRRYGADPAFALTLGNVLLSHGLTAQARELLQAANRAAPAQPEIVLPLAEASLQQRNGRATREALASIQQSSQNNAEYHSLLAQSCFLSNEKEQALAEIDRAVALSPETRSTC